MSRGALGKNNWALFLMLLAGIMLGGLSEMLLQVFRDLAG